MMRRRLAAGKVAVGLPYAAVCGFNDPDPRPDQSGNAREDAFLTLWGK